MHTKVHRMIAAYNKHDDCVHIGDQNGDQYCFHVSNNSLQYKLSGLQIFNSAYQSWVVINDIVYYMHANDKKIIKYDINNHVVSIVTNESASFVNTNYLFIVGQDLISGIDVNSLYIYDISENTQHFII